MKILYISRFYYPHIGGVEKHVGEISKNLQKKGNEITVLTEKIEKSQTNKEVVSGINIERFYYPHVKILGLFFIWWQMFKHRILIEKVDIVHIHDVFIWYLPLRFLYPSKSVFVTLHGLESDNPPSKISIWQKRVAVRLSKAVVGVGKYLEKYLNVKFNLITYGGIIPNLMVHRKNKNHIVYLGRLESNTGLEKFLKWIKRNPGYTIDFYGDGLLRKKCEGVGRVCGFVTNPTPFLQKAEYCVPGGYLGAMEALNAGCELKIFCHNKLRKEIWKMSPFVKKNARAWARTQTWDKLADQYLDLYKSK